VPFVTSKGNDPSDNNETPGIDRTWVEPWLLAHIDGLQSPLTWVKLAGGHSNFTYRVTDPNGQAFVFRRPPLGTLLPGAHDMKREFTVMTALWPTPVPVPEPLAFCDDETITGAVFYAMAVIDGQSLYTSDQVEALVPIERRRALADDFVDSLALLHSLDPVAVGLGSLGRPDAYVARQLKRWYMSWTNTRTVDRPDVDALFTFLGTAVPDTYTPTVVHGDYGLHNCVCTRAGTVGAVVDWEISTLGDPLADLTYMLNAWEAEVAEPVRPGTASSAPGFPPRAYLLARYCERRGISGDALAPYTAFNHWKTVCILDGVLARYLGGNKSTEGIDLEALGIARDRSIELAVAAARDVGFARAL
jgi:aminoglycoside phosphotransferase (APT) family kinase protein